LLTVPFSRFSYPPTGHVAVCDGGSGALGHPIEYIQLDTVSKAPAICKYCGLRFKMSHHH
jgi:NADH dehydrogenase (ubiquinone) Fe-S protein 6